MSAVGRFNSVAISAGADLSTMQYKIVDVSGTISADNHAALGVLLNKPKLGESAQVGYDGHMKAFVGGTVSAGDQLVVTTSGFLITNATSTSGIIGKAMKAANSGSLCEFVGNFSTARNSYSIGII